MRRLFPTLILISTLCVLVAGVALATTICTGDQGCTGYGAAATSSISVGQVLTVSSTGPHLTYKFTAAGSGSGSASGTLNSLAYFSPSTSTVTGDAGLTYNSSTSALTLQGPIYFGASTTGVGSDSFGMGQDGSGRLKINYPNNQAFFIGPGGWSALTFEGNANDPEIISVATSTFEAPFFVTASSTLATTTISDLILQSDLNLNGFNVIASNGNFGNVFAGVGGSGAYLISPTGAANTGVTVLDNFNNENEIWSDSNGLKFVSNDKTVTLASSTNAGAWTFPVSIAAGNVTSTNLFSTGLAFTNLNGTNATSTNLNFTLGTGTNLTLTSVTTTNFNCSGAGCPVNLLPLNNTWAGHNTFNVTTTFATTTATSSTIAIANIATLDGLSFVNTNINTTATTSDSSILFQNQTVASNGVGVVTGRVQVSPTFASSIPAVTNVGVGVSTTQNGTFTGTLAAMRVVFGNASTTVLGTANGILVASPTATGTITNVAGIEVQNQSVTTGTIAYGLKLDAMASNGRKSRSLGIDGTGVNNSVVFNNDVNQFSSSTGNITFSDSGNTGGINLTVVPGGGVGQTISTVSGTLNIAPANGGNVGINKVTPIALLDVNGTLNVSGTSTMVTTTISGIGTFNTSTVFNAYMDTIWGGTPTSTACGSGPVNSGGTNGGSVVGGTGVFTSCDIKFNTPFPTGKTVYPTVTVGSLGINPDVTSVSTAGFTINSAAALTGVKFFYSVTAH